MGIMTDVAAGAGKPQMSKATMPPARPPTNVKKLDDASESDLFLDLDEDTSEVSLEKKRQAAATAADKPAARQK